MNLIEKLGGYESAKEILKLRIIYGFDESAAELKQALLEHRRKHNIFEVGDKVIEAIEPFDEDLFEVTRIDEHHMLYSNYRTLTKCDLFDCHASRFIRHATDEEIKAGHRL